MVLAVSAAALHGEYVGKRGLALYGVDRRCGGFTRPVMPANAARHDMVLAVGAADLHGGYVGKRGLALYGVDRRCVGFTRLCIPANAARHCMALAVGAAALRSRAYRQTPPGIVWRWPSARRRISAQYALYDFAVDVAELESEHARYRGRFVDQRCALDYGAGAYVGSERQQRGLGSLIGQVAMGRPTEPVVADIQRMDVVRASRW